MNKVEIVQKVGEPKLTWKDLLPGELAVIDDPDVVQHNGVIVQKLYTTGKTGTFTVLTQLASSNTWDNANNLKLRRLPEGTVVEITVGGE